jgi:endonuclease G, mitochondrial
MRLLRPAPLARLAPRVALAPLAALVALATGCRDPHATPDAGDRFDANVVDAAPGPDAAPVDAGPDGLPDGIAAARASSDGIGLSLAIHGVTVTYLKPQIGSTTSDPAGFTIQAAKQGPGLFISVDPATLSPPAAVGDVVNFTITKKGTVFGQPRAQTITSYVRTATGANVGALAQNLSAATDVLTAAASYDGELITVTGTMFASPAAAGVGFQQAGVTTAVIAGDTRLQLRAPTALIDAIDMVKDCRFTATNVPLGIFVASATAPVVAQIDVFASADLTLACPAPTIVSTTALSPTSLRFTFSRNILGTSVLPGGSQFTFDNGLRATAAAVSGKTITLTTTTQTGTSYVATIARSVTDMTGAAVSPGTASFVGFAGPRDDGARLSKHTTLGIPSPSSMVDPDSFLSVKSEYVLSYNSGRKVPNWVSWELNASYLGAAPRQNDYRSDDTLPLTLPQASLADYSGSGYDRGHMCPSADRTLTIATNSQTFFLTNMVPQAANNNQGPWEQLESECRNLVATGKELFIISGGTFSAGSNTVGNGMVVPDQTFKVIVVLDAAGQGTTAVTASTRVIAVLMPNENTQIGISDDWHGFRVSVDTIEAQTGYDFLSDVDPAVQAVVEARIDNQ